MQSILCMGIINIKFKPLVNPEEKGLRNEMGIFTLESLNRSEISDVKQMEDQ